MNLSAPWHRYAKRFTYLATLLTLSSLKGRDGKLTLDDMTGGNFTITNGGVFGSLLSTPIINLPPPLHKKCIQIHLS